MDAKINEIFKQTGGKVEESFQGVAYSTYKRESEIEEIQEMIDADLSEPYSVFTFRYFIYNWPELCYIAKIDGKVVGAVVGKLDEHKSGTYRGYVAMLAVRKEHRHRKIGTILSRMCLDKMKSLDADECVLETEITNPASLGLYRSLGFVKCKRLYKYYLNGVDAFRLKKRFCDEQDLNTITTIEDKLRELRIKDALEKKALQKMREEAEAGNVQPVAMTQTTIQTIPEELKTEQESP
eukprot:gene399-3_t